MESFYRYLGTNKTTTTTTTTQDDKADKMVKEDKGVNAAAATDDDAAAQQQDATEATRQGEAPAVQDDDDDDNPKDVEQEKEGEEEEDKVKGEGGEDDGDADEQEAGEDKEKGHEEKKKDVSETMDGKDKEKGDEEQGDIKKEGDAGVKVKQNTDDDKAGGETNKLIVYHSTRRGRAAKYKDTNPHAESEGNLKYVALIRESSPKWIKADKEQRRKIVEDICVQFEFREQNDKPSAPADVRSRLRSRIHADAYSAVKVKTEKERGDDDDDDEEMNNGPRYKSDSESDSVEVMPTPKNRRRPSRGGGGEASDKDEEGEGRPKKKSKKNSKVKSEPGTMGDSSPDQEAQEPENPPLFGEEIVGRKVIVFFDLENKRKRVPYMGLVAAYEVNLQEEAAPEPRKMPNRRKKSHYGENAPPVAKKKKSYTSKVERLFRVVFIDGDDMWLDLSELKREGRLWFQDVA